MYTLDAINLLSLKLRFQNHLIHPHISSLLLLMKITTKINQR